MLLYIQINLFLVCQFTSLLSLKEVFNIYDCLLKTKFLLLSILLIIQTSKLVEAQIKASSKTGLRFAGALNVAAVAAKGLGAALKSAFAIFQSIAIAITSLQIIGSLFDFDVIGELTDAYKEFTAESRRTKAGLQDIINAAKEGTPVFNKLTSSTKRQIPWFEQFEHIFLFEFIHVINQEV